VGGYTEPEPVPADDLGPAAGGLALAAGEQVLWAGRPARVPWWLGSWDSRVSLYYAGGLAWAGLLCLLIAISGAAQVAAGLAPFLAAGCGYPIIGRVLHRRMRIRRTAYTVTSRRLIASWQLGTGQPVTVEALLAEFPEPEVRGQSVFLGPAELSGLVRVRNWRYYLWPAMMMPPPALIGIARPEAVRDLVAAAQDATRPAGAGDPG
jgi:hypothetical protein